ncbi:MAG: fur [Chthoniobacteraceae bacterium]|nr:fur [Chthoniobacteraceae bacterium]
MPPSHLPANSSLESALQTLRDHQARVTEPRRAILTILTSEHGPFTVEEIYQRIEKGVCDLVTVYRSLAAMEEINLVRRCDFGDGAYRYEFNTGDHHHHHIICRACRSVKTLDFCVADSLERMARQLGYENVTHTLEIFGVCVNCQKKAAHAGGANPAVSG